MISISDWLTVQVQDPQLCRAHYVCCTHWPLCPRMMLRSFPKQRRTRNYSCLFIHFTLPVQLVDVRHLGTCLLRNFLSRWGEQTSMQIPRHWWAWKIPQGREGNWWRETSCLPCGACVTAAWSRQRGAVIGGRAGLRAYSQRESRCVLPVRWPVHLWVTGKQPGKGEGEGAMVPISPSMT